MHEETVHAKVLSLVRSRSQAAARNAALPDDLNLVEAGFLDSIAFVSLLAEVEHVFNISLDLIEEPIETFVQIGSLTSYICRQLTMQNH